MPVVGVRGDLAFGELPHLLADRIQRVGQAAIADRGGRVRPHQVDQAGAIRRRVARGRQRLDGARQPRRDLGEREAEVGGTHDLALAHRNAADHLGQIFAETDPDQQVLRLAQSPRRLHSLRIGGELAHRLHVGGKPGKPMGGALLAIHRPGGELAVAHHPGAHRDGGVGEQRLGRHGGRTGGCNKIA